MALNIRPSSSSSSSNSTTQSSSKQSSTADLFAQGMAAAAKQSKPTRQATPAPKPSKPASTPKPKHAADDDSQSKRASSSRDSNGTSSKPKSASSASQSAANAQAGQDASPDDAAASEANAMANGAKGRAPTRTAPKNASAQDVAAKDAADGNTDTTNQSGLSLLQLLAKQLEGDDTTDTTASDAVTSAASDKTSADGTDKTSDDPNAIALAMFSQALAAALARQQAPTANAASGDAAAGITSATQSPGGAASMQDLMTVLAHDVAADAKGNSDDGATQFNVDPTKSTANDASSADPTAVNPNALTHLGVASHFAAQHLRNDTNTADLKSPVGSSAWQDEVATHLTWMTQKGLETGSLRVSPEHLGPVEVNISVQNGDASVWFAANHPDTRAALEQALPRLREMFANQGMNLADSGVSRQSLSQQGSRNQNRSAGSQGVTGISAVGAADGSSSASARINLGLVDLYA